MFGTIIVQGAPLENENDADPAKWVCFVTPAYCYDFHLL